MTAPPFGTYSVRRMPHAARSGHAPGLPFSDHSWSRYNVHQGELAISFRGCTMSVDEIESDEDFLRAVAAIERSEVRDALMVIFNMTREYRPTKELGRLRQRAVPAPNRGRRQGTSTGQARRSDFF